MGVDVQSMARNIIREKYTMQESRNVAPVQQTISPSPFNIRSSLRQLMGDAIDSSGVDGGYRTGLENLAKGVDFAVDAVPLVGDAIAVQDTMDSYRRGDLVDTGINATAAALGVIPVVGDAAGRAVQAGGNRVRSALRGIEAFHGSPYKFDKFSMGKMGTGEGAQAYGDGLYFAEEAMVAKGYQPRSFDAEELMMNKYKAAEKVQDYQTMEIWENAMMHETPDELIKRYNSPDYDDSMREKAAKVAAELNKMPAEGGLYNVNLNVDPDDLLDWDAPLSEQSDKVQGFWKSYLSDKEPDGIFKNMDGAIEQDASGRLIYEALGNPTESSQKLNEMGIKGIRYLDGTSRSAGEGTRNYVMFDESLIDTKRINDKLTDSWMNPEARMQRAEEGGFDINAFHGTNNNVKSFRNGITYTSSSPEVASDFAMYKNHPEGANVMPVKQRGNYLEVDAGYKDIREAEKNFGRDVLGLNDADYPNGMEIYDYAREQGYDGVKFANALDDVPNAPQMGRPSDIYANFEPKNIRSTNAEFDPTKADSSNLLSGISRSSLRDIA